MNIYKITVEDGQTVWDIAVQEYGTVEGLSLLLKDNNLSLSASLYPSQQLVIQLNPDLQNQDIRNYFRTKRIGVTSGAIAYPQAFISSSLTDNSNVLWRVYTAANDAQGNPLTEGSWMFKVYALTSKDEAHSNSDLIAAFSGDLSVGAVDISTLANVMDLGGYVSSQLYARTTVGSTVANLSAYWEIDKKNFATDNGWVGLGDAKCIRVEFSVADVNGVPSAPVVTDLVRCVQVSSENNTASDNTTLANGKHWFETLRAGGWLWTTDMNLFVSATSGSCGVTVYNTNGSKSLEIFKHWKGGLVDTSVTTISAPNYWEGLSNALASRLSTAFTFSELQGAAHGYVDCVDRLFRYYYSNYFRIDDRLEAVLIREVGTTGDEAKMIFNVIDTTIC